MLTRANEKMMILYSENRSFVPKSEESSMVHVSSRPKLHEYHTRGTFESSTSNLTNTELFQQHNRSVEKSKVSDMKNTLPIKGKSLNKTHNNIIHCNSENSSKDETSLMDSEVSIHISIPTFNKETLQL